MVYSIIEKIQLEGAERLDAEFYQPQYLEFAKKLVRIGEVSLGEVAFITDGQHGYHIVDPISEVRHITAKNVIHWLINDKYADRLSLKTHNANKRSSLEIGDLLISTAGTIGAVGIVLKDILPANIDQDVARIHILDKNKVDPYFLVAFLNSKYGQFQIVRETTGQIQTHLALEKIKNRIFMPIPKWQNVISEIVKLAIENLNKSKKFYTQAEDLLLGELGLADFKPRSDLSFIVDLDEVVDNSDRVDADFFQPKYKELVLKIKQKDYKLLLEAVDDIQSDFLPQKFADKSFNYVELADIDSSLGIISGSTEILGKDAPSRAKRLLKSGDIIVSSIEGSLEKVALVAKEQNDFIASNGFFQFRTNNILPEVLLVIAKSIVLQMQLKQNCAGTILSAVPRDALKNMIIPILPKEKQRVITGLVRKSHEVRKKSKELLEEAKGRVEKMIEKGRD